MTKLEDERKKQLDVIKQELDKGVGLDKNELIRALRHSSKDSIFEFARVAKQNIIEGKTFISDEEATTLGVAFTTKCIELKMGMLNLVDGVTGLMIALVDGPTNFEIKDYSAELADMIWKGISVSRNIELTARAAKAISSKSVLALTFENMITGKRLTKR